MKNTNRVVILGNLTKNLDDKTFGYIGNGCAKASLSVAVNRPRKQGEEWINETSFIDVVVFGKDAENLKPYLVKGQKIAIDGYLKQDRWEKDGKKFNKLYVVAEGVELCGSKSNSVKAETVAAEPDNDFPEDVPF